MKTYQVYLILFLILSSTAFSQINGQRMRSRFDKNTVVLDSTGKPYSYSEWNDLLKSGGVELRVKKSNNGHVDTAKLVKAKPFVKMQVPDMNSIVVDSSGREYAYDEWKKLVSGHEATLRFRKGKDTVPDMFLLTRLSPAEIERRKALREASELKYKPKETPFFTTGDKIKGLKYRDLTGKKYRAEDLQGKVLVFNFWFINCPPCRAEIPELNKLVAKFKDNPDVIFLALATDNARSLSDFLDKVPFNFNIIPDGKYESLGSKVRLYPTHLVLGRDGTVMFHASGGEQRILSWVEKTINEALVKKGDGV